MRIDRPVVLWHIIYYRLIWAGGATTFGAYSPYSPRRAVWKRIDVPTDPAGYGSHEPKRGGSRRGRVLGPSLWGESLPPGRHQAKGQRRPPARPRCRQGVS